MKQALLFIVGMWSSIPALAQIDYLEITGPTDVPENVTAYYASILHFVDGSQVDVTQAAAWSVNPGDYATFDAPGVLSVLEVPGDQLVTVEAVIVEVPGTLDVTIRDTDLRFVDSGAMGDGNGESWDDAFTTLQGALVGAAVGAEIRVAQGTYRPDQSPSEPGDRIATFQLISGVAIYGGYGGLGEPDPDVRDVELYETILSGDIGTPGDSDDNSYHVVTGSGTDSFAVLDGFTITAGNANGEGYEKARGAGMYCVTGSPTLADCVFTANTADGYIFDPKFGKEPFGEGGGIYSNNGADLTLTNCIFMNNFAYGGGGGMFNRASQPSLISCTFNNNSSIYNGGGLNNRILASPLLVNCVFFGNSVPIGRGGGMNNEGGCDPTLINCLFLGNSTGNTSARGGGMSNFSNCDPLLLGCMFIGNSSTHSDGGGLANMAGSNATLINCLFTGNMAGRHGGAIYNWGAGTSLTFPTLINCTIAGNIADSWGNGVGDGGGVADTEGSTSTVTNSILWGNSDSGPQDESAQFYSLETDPIINYSCMQGWTGAFGGVGNVGDDPLFIDADGPDDEVGTEDDDLRLQPCSPVVDGGSNGALPNDVTVDLDGDPRFVDGNGDGSVVVDMGAYEFQADVECCWADLDGDGDVGPADLGTLLGAWGPCSPNEDCPADLDADGEVAAFDLAILLGAWGPCED